MGLHWDVLLISLFVSIGILYYAIASVNIPKVGKISLETVKTLEKNDLIPSIIERVMKWINEMTIKDLDENKIFKLRSYCRSAEYKGRISGSKQLLYGGFGRIEGNNSFCIIDEDDLKGFFETIFEAEYNEFKKEDFSTIDLSKTIYTSSIGKEDKYFNIVNTSNGIDIPINIEKKQIGKFTMKPVFKFPVDYAFDDKNKEVCILSKDCGAVCDDVIARYSGEIEFRKKSNSCNEYFFCTSVFPDDFGLKYPCDTNFCMESGIASCSNAADDTVCPDCCCTPWTTGCGIGGCGAEEMGYVRECKLDGCDIETKCEANCNCEPPCFCDKLCCGVRGDECGPCGLDTCPPTPPPPVEPPIEPPVVGGEDGEGATSDSSNNGLY